MNAALVYIVAMQFIALMLAAILAIVWRTYERPRHALTWAIAFVIAAVDRLLNTTLRIWQLDDALLYDIVAAVGCLFSALIAVGFVQRAKPGASSGRLVARAVLAVGLVAFVTSLFPYGQIHDGIWLLFGGTMLAISAAQVIGPVPSSTLPERATARMLALFAVADFAMAAVAFGAARNGGAASAELYRTVLVLLYPPIFIGVGLFAVLLVAADLAERMRALAVSDLLTGIPNRRGFEEAAERAIRNAQRQRQPLTLVVSDIDRFKAINDRYGHVAGDRAIQHFARRLERIVRRGDLIGRIGGEEFALVLVNTDSLDAMEVVERIRSDVAAVAVEGPDPIVMTASFGVTNLRPDDVTLANLFARADRALYRSKIEGRDRVTCAEKMELATSPHGKTWVTSDRG
ncbi:diguanylate cyclase (GGDEF) domain-containing protein [Sphingomonas sp. YR710]|nr:diguanylate cyclase (GGDEF) domain-containing protein [Sphingomonas sp. YR710]